MQVKLWIGRERNLGIEKEAKIGESCGDECGGRAFATLNQKVATAAIYREAIKRRTRLPCSAQTDTPWRFTIRAEI
jgi:hypothetical protein